MKSAKRNYYDAKVLPIGAGGLGSPAGTLPGGGGVGTIGIIDDARGRRKQSPAAGSGQHAWIGKPKAESARNTTTGINPDVKVNATRPADQGNAFEILEGYDLIVIEATTSLAPPR